MPHVKIKKRALGRGSGIFAPGVRVALETAAREIGRLEHFPERGETDFERVERIVAEAGSKIHRPEDRHFFEEELRRNWETYYRDGKGPTSHMSKPVMGVRGPNGARQSLDNRLFRPSLDL